LFYCGVREKPDPAPQLTCHAYHPHKRGYPGSLNFTRAHPAEPAAAATGTPAVFGTHNTGVDHFFTPFQIMVINAFLLFARIPSLIAKVAPILLDLWSDALLCGRK